MPSKVEISHKTIIFTFVFLVSVWFVYYIRDIVFELFLAFLLVSILNPFVEKLSKYRVPKGLSVIFSYLLVFGLFGLAIASLLPPLVEQTTNLALNLPKYLQDLGVDKFANGELLKQVVSQLGSLPGQIIKLGFSLFGNLINILTVLIFSFYLLLKRDKLHETLEYFFGRERGNDLYATVNKIEMRLGGWARGQLTLMLLIGLLSYVGLSLLRIPYALPLALLSGILEIVPYVGPILAAIPAIILGLSISPLMGLAVGILAFVIQQLENYVFVPKIMEKSTGVSPVIVLISLAIGSRIAGIAGMLVSIPVVIILYTLYFNKFRNN